MKVRGQLHASAALPKGKVAANLGIAHGKRMGVMEAQLCALLAL
jgi:hypothetical protein